MRILTTFVLFSLLFCACKNEKLLAPKAQAIIEEIRAEAVPDKRVAVFNIKANERQEVLTIRGETNLPAAKEKLRNLLTASQIEFVDSIKILPAKELNGMEYGVVRLSVCNIRSNPKHSAEMATQALLGTPLKVLKEHAEKKGWYYIQTPDGYLGWLDSDGFTLMNENDYRVWQAQEKVIIQSTNTRAYAYREPFNFTSETPIISDLIFGNILALVKDAESGLVVSFPDGRMGYISKRNQVAYQQWKNEPMDSSYLLSTAHRFMGVPYLWGGTSGKGFDCSGYTKTVYYWHGYLLPRDASQQVHVGQEIETDTATLANLQPNDLLFFGVKATDESKEKVRHVAIYMGDGKMIHAAGNVRVQSLRRGDPDFAEDRLQTFLRAKRIIGATDVPRMSAVAGY